MTKTGTLIGAIVATCALVASAALAQGATVKVDTTVKMRKSSPTFHGAVLADNENCVEGRKVKLYRRPAGGHAKKVLMGKTTAKDTGKWKIKIKIPDEPQPQNYFAVAPKVKQGTAGTIYVCKKGKSKKQLIQ